MSGVRAFDAPSSHGAVGETGLQTLRRRLDRRLRARPKAHLIHVGKTGGSGLKIALRPVARQGTYDLFFHMHNVGLRDIPPGEKVFFTLRDPVSRFISGFNMRLREGRPRFDAPWTPDEKVAFEWFSTPSGLAEALSSPDAETYERALAAMTAIRHVRDTYWQWFGNRDYLRSRLGDILLIQWLPDMTQTYPRLRELLGLPDSVTLPADEVASNRTPSTLDTGLTPLARFNLERWYARDRAFLDLCAGLDCFAGPSFTADKPSPAIPDQLVPGLSA